MSVPHTLHHTLCHTPWQYRTRCTIRYVLRHVSTAHAAPVRETACARVADYRMQLISPGAMRGTKM
eukprot:3092676-Rhodomonas_salina.1